MATRKKQATRKNNTLTIEPTIRHLWLATLGTLVAVRRESKVAVRRVVATAGSVAGDARKAVTRVQTDLRGNIDDMRGQVQPKVMKFSSDVEARLAPVLDKLGLKSKAKRKARKTVAKLPRRTVRKPAKRTAKQAAS